MDSDSRWHGGAGAEEELQYAKPKTVKCRVTCRHLSNSYSIN